MSINQVFRNAVYKLNNKLNINGAAESISYENMKNNRNLLGMLSSKGGSSKKVLAEPFDNLSDRNIGSHFTIFNAQGGKIVQVVTYDKREERNISTLYIIPDGEDLGAELGEILTREALSR